jgi:hypothetical protein
MLYRSSIAAIALATVLLVRSDGAQAGIVLVGSPADFGNIIADETEKWGTVIRAANIKAE